MEAEDLIEDKIQLDKQGRPWNSNSAERGDNAESSAILSSG
jgi:hypothetical protein